MRSPSRHRWFVVVVFFFFMLLHQSDKLLIGPLTTPVMDTFHIDEAQMGVVFTGALIVGGLSTTALGGTGRVVTRAEVEQRR